MSNTILQPAVFLALIYGGIAAGLAYDIFRLVRRIFRARLICTLADICALLACFFVFVVTLLFSTGGEFRPYHLMGFALGFLIQQISISYLFFRLFYYIRSIFIKR